jgi:hypothetical protein
VTVLNYRRARLVLMLALCAAWTATPLIADICAAASAHCHRQLPCCPPSGGSKNCSPALCPAQASQRAVRVRAVGERAQARSVVVPVRSASKVRHLPVRELIAGLHYLPPVFRLKDDLRI